MRPSDLSRHLAQHGSSPDEALRKQALFDLILAAFAGVSAAPAEHALWVPGRLEIFGKHTDYGGGHSLVAPVPRGFALVAGSRSDGIVTIHDASRREHFVIASQSGLDADEALKGWRRYALTTVRRIARNFPGAPLGADIVLASDLPPASGMSSSSALIVALAATLVRRGQLEARAEWQANITDAADTAGYYACIENGLPFGSLTGDAGVGTHGGSEDHVAIVCGKPDHGSAWTFVPVAHVADVRIPAGWRFVIASSGVAARKTGAARDGYNNLALGVRTLLEIWNTHEPAQPSLRAALTSDSGAEARLRSLVGSAPRTSGDLDLPARLEHFIAEDRRVMQAVRALQESDGQGMGQLSRASQEDAERLLRNQTPETSALTSTARDLGALASSSFGAGFGGSVWALVKKEDASSFSARWLAEFRTRFPARETATVFEAPPGPPLTWIT